MYNVSLEEKCKLSVGDLFSKVAALNADTVAIEFEGKGLTYKDLDLKSNQASHHLCKNLEIQKGDFVGVSLERSIDLIIWMIGIFKSGGIYVPISASLPENRLKTMFDDTKMKYLLMSDQSENSFMEYFDGQIIVSSEDIFLSNEEYSNPSIDGESLCACIFTSGSTGTPKGVLVCHRNIIHLGVSSFERLKLRKKVDRYANFASKIFIVSFSDFFTPLLNGIPLIIIPDRARKNPHELLKVVNLSKITCLHIPPAMLKLLPRSSSSSSSSSFTHELTFIRVSGEACDFDSMHYWSKSEKVKNMYNSYGSTESVSTLISRSLYVLISASSAILATNIAKKRFNQQCNQDFFSKEECPPATHSIISEIDNCEKKETTDVEIEENNEKEDEKKYICFGPCVPLIEELDERFQEEYGLDIEEILSGHSELSTVTERMMNRMVSVCQGLNGKLEISATSKNQAIALFLEKLKPVCEKSSKMSIKILRKLNTDIQLIDPSFMEKIPHLCSSPKLEVVMKDIISSGDEKTSVWCDLSI